MEQDWGTSVTLFLALCCFWTFRNLGQVFPHFSTTTWIWCLQLTKRTSGRKTSRKVILALVGNRRNRHLPWHRVCHVAEAEQLLFLPVCSLGQEFVFPLVLDGDSTRAQPGFPVTPSQEQILAATCKFLQVKKGVFCLSVNSCVGNFFFFFFRGIKFISLVLLSHLGVSSFLILKSPWKCGK